MSSRRRSIPKSQPDQAGETRGQPEQGAVSCFLNRNLIPVLIFLFALFFIITFSNPALFLNDEWITVNQLHQLGEGHQVTVNEGKYGTFQNGTPGPYFEARHNLLGYTMMLPILSLPALKVFGLFGDQSRLAIVLLWSMLPVAMAILVDAYRPQYARWRGIRWTWFVIGAAFLGLLANLAFYSPWPFTALDAPVETAAVVFTNHLLFAALAVMVYLTCKTIFEDTWFSLFGTIACISCSSYIFWAANAKDHMLLVAMMAAVILFLVRYIRYGGLRDAALGFAFIGLLAWARPEVGFTVFVFAALYYVGLQVSRGLLQMPPVEAVRALCAPLATLAGAVPLLVNNALVTGNPLVPAFYVYEKKLLAGTSGEEIIGAAEAVNGVVQSVPAPSGGVAGFLSVLANHFAPSWSTLPGDIFGILFAPASGNMSLVAVSPLIIIALVVLPILLWRRPGRFTTADRQIILFLVVVGIAVWVAYLRSMHGLNTSNGIVPDIRYLTPFYLPAGILAILAIHKLAGDISAKTIAMYGMLSVLLTTPLLILFIMIFQPYGGAYLGYTIFFSRLTYIILGAVLVTLILQALGIVKIKWTFVTIAVLVTIPLGWQIMMLFLYSIAKFNGYELWIPLVETFYANVIGISYLS